MLAPHRTTTRVDFPPISCLHGSRRSRAQWIGQAQRAAGAARPRRRGDRIGHHNRAVGVLVARAISSPTFSLKVGVSNGAISLQYIHSRTDLSVLITFSEEALFFGFLLRQRARPPCSWARSAVLDMHRQPSQSSFFVFRITLPHPLTCCSQHPRAYLGSCVGAGKRLDQPVRDVRRGAGRLNFL